MSLADVLNLPTDATPARPVAPAAPKLPTIAGYAAVFYNPADPSTAFVDDDGTEARFTVGAFDGAIVQGECLGRFNHEHTLGRLSAGTLRLSVDTRGLRFEIDPPDTPMGRHLVRLIRGGQLTGSSLFYSALDVIERTEGGRKVREVLSAKVYDVGPVDRPRCPAAGCWVREAGPGPEAARDADELAAVLAVWANEIQADS